MKLKRTLSLRRWLLLGVIFSGGALARAATASTDPIYHLPAPPMELMASEEKFLPFAQAVKEDVGRLLLEHPDLAREKLLLGMRVHLALHLGEDDVALSAAARIRHLTADPADKAFAGLTTEAAVAAKKLSKATPGEATYRAAFEKRFIALLATLPKTPEIAEMLRRQREKNSGISREALLQEVRDKIAPAIAQRGFATLEDVDQLVRARHRLTDIVPIRAETLRALEGAIADRTRP